MRQKLKKFYLSICISAYLSISLYLFSISTFSNFKIRYTIYYRTKIRYIIFDTYHIEKKFDIENSIHIVSYRISIWSICTYLLWYESYRCFVYRAILYIIHSMYLLCFPNYYVDQDALHMYNIRKIYLWLTLITPRRDEVDWSNNIFSKLKWHSFEFITKPNINWLREEL